MLVATGNGLYTANTLYVAVCMWANSVETTAHCSSAPRNLTCAVFEQLMGKVASYNQKLDRCRPQ